jgi:hypothetical protein
LTRGERMPVGWLIVALMGVAFVMPGAAAGLSLAAGWDPSLWIPASLRSPRGIEAAHACLVLHQHEARFDKLYLSSLYVTFVVLSPLSAMLGFVLGLSTTLRELRAGELDSSKAPRLLLWLLGLCTLSALFVFDMWRVGALMSLFLCEHSDWHYLFRSLPAAAASLSAGTVLTFTAFIGLPRVVAVLIRSLRPSE